MTQPDSPGKFREMLGLLEPLLDPERAAEEIHAALRPLYGDAQRAWRGVRLRWALERAEQADGDEEYEQANEEFEREAKRELQQVREELEICELEQGPLSKAGEASRLLEAMGSRRWSWIRQQQTFLSRAIDRKEQVLIELRRETLRAEKWATQVAHSRAAPARNSGGNVTGGGPGRSSGDGPIPAAAAAGDSAQGDEASSGPAPSEGPSVKAVAETSEANGQREISRGAGRRGGARNDRLDVGRTIRQSGPEGDTGICRPGDDRGTQDRVAPSIVGNNGGNGETKPLSPSAPAGPWGQLEPWVIDSQDLSDTLAAAAPPNWMLETPWSPVSRS